MNNYACLSNQSDHQSSREATSLEKKKGDLKMLKKKNQNLEFCHTMKGACTLS